MQVIKSNEHERSRYLHLEKFKLHDYTVDYRGSTAVRGYFGNFSPKADRPLRASLSLHSRSKWKNISWPCVQSTSSVNRQWRNKFLSRSGSNDYRGGCVGLLPLLTTSPRTKGIRCFVARTQERGKGQSRNYLCIFTAPNTKRRPIVQE